MHTDLPVFSASYRVYRPDIPAQACLETRPFPGTDLNLSAMQAPGILSNIQSHFHSCSHYNEENAQNTPSAGTCVQKRCILTCILNSSTHLLACRAVSRLN